MAYPVFDLHCDTADRIGWATLDLDLRFTAGTDGYFPGDETHPQDFDLIEGNACAISLAKIGNTPWAQCFATFVPDEIPHRPRRALPGADHGAHERPGNAQPRPHGQRT